MFSSSIRSTLIALVLSTAAVSAAPGLSLKVSGPEHVDGVDKLDVVVTVSNTGSEALKLLNNPSGALSAFPAETFRIASESGSSPAFTGRRLKYSIDRAAASSDPDAFTLLAPGESKEITHALGAAYNFTSSGEGVYTFEANNLFHFVDPVTSAAVPIYADADAHVSRVAGKLAVARTSAHTGALTKRAPYVGCTAARQTLLVAAASGAQSYASAAVSYLTSHTATSARFTTWFGTWTSAHRTTVLSHYTKMVARPYANYIYDCSTCNEAGVYAYTYPTDPTTIYLCPVFWQVATTGTDSKAGTLIHESSHFNVIAGTEDYAYGQTAAKSLAKSNSAEAIENADNHEYFAENNPALA